MKKSKYLALVLVASIILVGAAYAAWTDSIIINTSIATGSMDVRFDSDPTKTFGELWVGDTFIKDLEPGEGLSVSDKAIQVNVQDMYPGMEMGLNFWMQNFGTIPVVCKDVTVDFGPGTSQALKDTMVVNWFYLEVYDADGVFKETALEFDDEANPIPLSELEALLQDGLINKLELGPGDSVTLKGGSSEGNYFLELPLTAGNDTQKANLSMTINLDWKQFNR